MANKKRLIDAWKLVIDLAKIKKCGEYDHEDVLAVIASQKTVDAVEIPDCNKCAFNDGIAYWHKCENCLGAATNNFVTISEVNKDDN